MNRLKSIGALMAVALLAAPATFAAPQDEGDTYVRHDARDWEDDARYSLGLGLGLISLDDPGQADDVEIYGTINFRIAVGPGHSRPGSWRGYLEPELGYWESGTGIRGQTSQSLGRSDLLLGLNIVGVMPFQAVDFFLGAGAGIHFIDEDIRVFSSTGTVDRSDSDEALGVNAHFGVDVGISRNVSLFGVGRFDIVDDSSNSLDAKAYLGLRLRFGGNRPDRWSPDED
jgi:opacity protein-like surface antigen